MNALFQDTIAAVATAAGRGALAIVRASGSGCRQILSGICPESAVEGVRPRTQHLRAIHHPETRELLDRALVSFFPGPRSFTGEDMLEVCTHGGVLTPQLVLGAMYAAGARPAYAGEFTRRAVLNGKLDLLQAEAIGDLIDGRSPAFHRAAIHQMERGLSRRIERLRAQVLEVEALITYSIDFPDEDEPPVPPARIAASAEMLHAELSGLLSTAPEGEMLREGAMVVLAGRPNAGKSSLFNALLGTERALVTELPGTTRDAVEAPVTIAGYPFRLVDTAGLREGAERIEELGIEVARRYLQAADITLFCAEAGRPLYADERAFLDASAAERTVLVRTKAEVSGGRLPQVSVDGGEIPLSVHSGEGLQLLRRRLLELSFGGILNDSDDAPLITNARHARALRVAQTELVEFIASLGAALPMELSATHLRTVAVALEEIIGIVSTDDVLGRVFGDFCVGK